MLAARFLISTTSTLFCLGCRAVSSSRALRDGAHCPRCGDTRFLAWNGERWGPTAIDLRPR